MRVFVLRSGRDNPKITMRILIVDDEPNIRRTLRVALEAMGHAVGEASSGPRRSARSSAGRATSPWST